MIKNQPALIITAAAAILVLVSGCFSLQRSMGEKKLYSLELKADFTARESVHPESVLIKEFDMAPMYTSSSFVYRRGEFEFNTDYYNEFIIPPQRMITAAVKQALFDSKLFSPVLPGSPADYRLNGRVNRLYADFRQPDHPRAVMEISITLDRMSLKGEKKSIGGASSKTFSKNMAIKDKTPEALIKGWNTLLKEIIETLIKQIQTES